MRQSFMLAALLLLSSAGAAQGPEAVTRSAAATAPGAAANADLDKKVCKKSVEIGTLARMTKTCLTRRQWLAVSEEARVATGEMQAGKGHTSGQ